MKLRWKRQENSINGKTNANEIYSIRGLTETQSDGVLISVDFLEYDHIDVQWPTTSVSKNMIWDTFNERFPDMVLDFHLGSFEKIYIYLVRTRDVDQFDARISEVYADINNSDPAYKNTFCNRPEDVGLDCDNLIISQPKLKQWNVQLEWLYLPKNPTAGYLYATCDPAVSQCNMDEAWIGCRDAAEDVPDYSFFEDTRIFSNASSHTLSGDGATLNTWDKPIPVSNPNSFADLTCYVTFKSHYIANAFGHLFKITESVKILNIPALQAIKLPQVSNQVIIFPKKRYSSLNPPGFPGKNYPARELTLSFEHEWLDFQTFLDMEWKMMSISLTFNNGTEVVLTNNNNRTVKTLIDQSYTGLGGNKLKSINEQCMVRFDVVTQLDGSTTRDNFPLLEESDPYTFEFMLPEFGKNHMLDYTYHANSADQKIYINLNQKIPVTYTNKNNLVAHVTDPRSKILTTPVLNPTIVHREITDSDGIVRFESSQITLDNMEHLYYENQPNYLTVMHHNDTVLEMPLYLRNSPSQVTFVPDSISGVSGISASWNFVGHTGIDHTFLYEVTDATSGQVVVPWTEISESSLGIDQAAQAENAYKYINGNTYNLQVKARYSLTANMDTWPGVTVDDSPVQTVSIQVNFELLGVVG